MRSATDLILCLTLLTSQMYTFDKYVYLYILITDMDKSGQNLIPIGGAAHYLGVTPTTLRRWHKDGTFRATFVSPGKHLYYSLVDLRQKTKGLVQAAFEWASSSEPFEPIAEWYCPTSDVFKARLERMTRELLDHPKHQALAPLIVSAAGEIGNNSYDHNLGNWPDILGTVFVYDLGKRIIVLADRGMGVLTTLRRIQPELGTDELALETAFTKIITGRAPEHRGNGLKYVRRALNQARAKLDFRSGTAKLELASHDQQLRITSADPAIRGCFAVIQF